MKESRSMQKRLRGLRTLAVTVGAALMLLVALPLSSASADSPWWQVLTGSHPTHLWTPTDNVQEIHTTLGAFLGNPGLAAAIKAEGKTIGCLGTNNTAGKTVLQRQSGLSPDRNRRSAGSAAGSQTGHQRGRSHRRSGGRRLPRRRPRPRCAEAQVHLLPRHGERGIRLRGRQRPPRPDDHQPRRRPGRRDLHPGDDRRSAAPRRDRDRHRSLRRRPGQSRHGQLRDRSRATWSAASSKAPCPPMKRSKSKSRRP